MENKSTDDLLKAGERLAIATQIYLESSVQESPENLIRLQAALIAYNKLVIENIVNTI